MKNPAVFDNPDQMIPERHLDSNGNFKLHPQNIPFGVGKRRCVGETLAKVSKHFSSIRIKKWIRICFQIELFLFFSAFINRTKPSFGFSHTPQPFKVVLRKR